MRVAVATLRRNILSVKRGLTPYDLKSHRGGKNLPHASQLLLVGSLKVHGLNKFDGLSHVHAARAQRSVGHAWVGVSKRSSYIGFLKLPHNVVLCGTQHQAGSSCNQGER